MADYEEVKYNPGQWQFNFDFLDGDKQPIKCDRSDCTIGSYILEISNTGISTGPACATCEFKADLGDVFNPDEPRYKPGAPEDYKTAAARILLNKYTHSPVNGIRLGRPDTWAMIDAYETTV